MMFRVVQEEISEAGHSCRMIEMSTLVNIEIFTVADARQNTFIVRHETKGSESSSDSWIESSKEKTIKEANKPLRHCGKCHEMVNHDSRNCDKNPTKFKEEESTKSNFNNSSNACQEGGRVESFSACFLSTFTKRTSRGAKGFPDCSFSTHTHAQSFDSSSNIRRLSGDERGGC
ncbi:protein FAR1-RELATED SEQUENCE 1-like [Salvia divinorum]|uniref:Protein FAR1-RELATED SEQUENCE 1-like n=1 Tax=Salvia divinorum TaxID=28513 RepID=A0ABD1HW59_SALDI